MTIYERFDQIEDDFQQELEELIEDQLGYDSTESQKEQLFESISLIFSKVTEKCINRLQNQSYGQHFYPYTSNSQNINNKVPSINIVIPAFAPNSFSRLPQGYYQPSMNQFNMPNPMMPQYPNQMQMFQPPQFPQQTLLPFNYYPLTNTKSSKKGGKSSKNHDSKSKSKKDSKRKSKSGTSDQKVSKKDKGKKTSGNYEIKKFSYNPSNPLIGIFHFLTIKTGGNIHDNNTIEVTSDNILKSIRKGEGQDPNHPKNLLNDDLKSFYRPDKSMENFFIQFDFKNMEVEISSYVIRTAGKGHANMKNWVFEISEDGSKWTQIDSHNDYTYIQDTVNFEVNKKRFVRYARIHQTGPPSENTLRLWINAVEFYGKLKMPE